MRANAYLIKANRVSIPLALLSLKNSSELKIRASIPKLKAQHVTLET
jgi:hypothetical protein